MSLRSPIRAEIGRGSVAPARGWVLLAAGSSSSPGTGRAMEDTVLRETRAATRGPRVTAPCGEEAGMAFAIPRGQVSWVFTGVLLTAAHRALLPPTTKGADYLWSPLLNCRTGTASGHPADMSPWMYSRAPIGATAISGRETPAGPR